MDRRPRDWFPSAIPEAEAQTPAGLDRAATARRISLEQCIADGWDELCLAAGLHDPLRRSDRLDAWQRHMAAAPGTTVIAAYRGGEMVAAWPLATRRRKGLRFIEPIGELGQWIRPGPAALDDDGLRTVLNAVRRAPADILRVSGLGVSPPFEAALRAEFPAVALAEGDSTYRVHLIDEARLKSRRRRVGAALRRATREGTPIASEILRRPDETSAALPTLLDLHARHWPAAVPNRLVGTAERRRFNQETLAAAAARGELLLALVRVGGRLAAFNLVLVTPGGAVEYTRTFDRTLGHLALGSVSALAAYDALRDEGHEWCELGLGGDDFKRQFGEAAPTWDLTAGLSLTGRAALAARSRRRRVPTTQP